MGRYHSTLARAALQTPHTFGTSRQHQPPPPILVSQEFVGRRPTEITLLRLSRASPSERIHLARRIVERFVLFPAQPDDTFTVESAEALFLTIVAFRVGMKKRGRDNGDGNVIKAMQNLLADCVTRENAPDIAKMMDAIHVYHLDATPEDFRSTARPLVAQILMYGFTVVTPEIRKTAEGDFLVIAETSREDRLGEWRTIRNMLATRGTIIPEGARVLVPLPLPRPVDWYPGSARVATIINGERPVFVSSNLFR